VQVLVDDVARRRRAAAPGEVIGVRVERPRRLLAEGPDREACDPRRAGRAPSTASRPTMSSATS
jgi:hypothetical protein